MLTIQNLKDHLPGILKCGIVSNTKIKLEQFHSQQQLRWVAKRGIIHDWAIYIAPIECSYDVVLKYGEKVRDNDIIVKLVPCDEQALGMYRK